MKPPPRCRTTAGRFEPRQAELDTDSRRHWAAVPSQVVTAHWYSALLNELMQHASMAGVTTVFGRWLCALVDDQATRHADEHRVNIELLDVCLTDIRAF